MVDAALKRRSSTVVSGFVELLGFSFDPALAVTWKSDPFRAAFGACTGFGL
jgi:hypothetical protein